MPDALLYGLVLVVALACPAHMWWAGRRGRQAACCPPTIKRSPRDLEALEARRTEIQDRLAELEVEAPSASSRTLSRG